jgi:hypothetical protein
VGSFVGTSDELRTRRCGRSQVSKYFRNFSLISFPLSKITPVIRDW